MSTPSYQVAAKSLRTIDKMDFISMLASLKILLLMESKYFASNWNVLNIMLFWVISFHPVDAQNLYYKDYKSALLRYDSTIDISKYSTIYIIHIKFCSSKRYCGESLIDYISKKQGTRVLIFCDDTNDKFLSPLKNKDSFEIRYLDPYYLQKIGLFSVYNLEISTKKKKVKKLI